MSLQKNILLSGLFALTAASTAFAADDVNVVDIKGAAKTSLTDAVATPLMNYETDARQKELERVTANMLMKAPSADKSLADTKIISQIPMKATENKSTDQKIAGNKAYALSGIVMSAVLPVEGQNNPNKFQSKTTLYEKYGPYFASDTKDPNLLGGLSIANILQSDVVTNDQVSKDLMNLLTDPYPQSITVPNKDSSGKDKGLFADRVVGQALLSVPANALAEMLARRTPGTGDNPKSAMQIMRAQTEGRISDPTWPAALATLSQEALLREIAYMQACDLYMQYQQYRLNEQAVSLLSVLVSAQAKLGPMMADMANQMAQAKAAQ